MASDPYLPYVSRLPLSWPDSDGPVARDVEGTLVFVDVAGFTALSERLSRSGRAGAEEVTDLLGGAFARLLATAYEDGGSLLSFGGDALLLFFTGPDHSRRAAHAAGVIRLKPKEIGALPTSVGSVRLKLSMGAHSGTFRFCVVGEDSRVLLLLGEDVTRTVRLEQRAQGGQVLVGASLAAAVPEAVGPLEDGAAFLLRTPRPPLVGDPEPPSSPVTRPERFLAPALREHVSATPGSEHRRVAVGFVQLRGTDALVAADPDATTQHVHEVVVQAQRAAAEYGVCLLGSDVDADGAKLILVGGAPRATEDEEERLLRACRAVLDLETPLLLRAGVTAGPVFVGDVGPPYRRTYTVMGERVNLAARLMASAERAELRTLPSVLEASRTTFATTSLEPLVLKGIREPVHAVAVGAPRDRGQRRLSGGLVGRQDELARLRAALAGATAGEGTVAELVGAPGIGKSAVVAALAEEAEVPTLSVAAAPYEAETPLGLVKRILRQLLGIDAEAPATQVRARAAELLQRLAEAELAHVLVAADAAEADDAALVPDDDLFLPRLSRAVRRALATLVPGPGLLVLEDVHVADPSSLAVVKGVADHLDEHPWLLCVTKRPTGTGLVRPLTDDALVLELGPLEPDAAADLVEALTPDRPMTPRRVSALVERAAGNPLFLTQLVRSDLDADDLPESVEAVVNARIDNLPSYLRKLVRQASVLGAVFELDLLAALAGFVPDKQEWRDLDGVLLRRGSRAAFANEVFRDVAYAALPYRDRRTLHGSAGRALAARGSADVELLALHAAQAQDDELTWRYATEAGRRAQARGGHEQAALFFERSLLAHARGGHGSAAEALEVHTLLGDSLVRAGRAQDALSAYREARRLSPHGTRGDALLCHKEALARIELGDHEGALRWLRQGLRVADPDPLDPVRLALAESLAGVHYRQGSYRASVRVLHALIAVTEGTQRVRAYAHAHDLLHLVLTTTGDPRRKEHRTQAVAVYEQLGDLQGLAKALNNLGTDAYHECRWTEAVALFERCRACDEQDANEIGAAISDSNIAEVLLDQGYFDEARARLTRALRTFRAADFRLGIAEVCNHLGRLGTREGRWGDATRSLAEARQEIETMGADSLLPEVVLREAELAAFSGDTDGAEVLLDTLEALTEVRAEMGLAVPRLRAVICARRGRDAEAVRLLREALAASDDSAPFSVALLRHALAMVLARSNDPEAALHLAAAVETLQRLGVVQFRDPLAGDEPVVVAPPSPRVITLVQQRAAAEAAAV